MNFLTASASNLASSLKLKSHSQTNPASEESRHATSSTTTNSSSSLIVRKLPVCTNGYLVNTTAATNNNDVHSSQTAQQTVPPPMNTTNAANQKGSSSNGPRRKSISSIFPHDPNTQMIPVKSERSNSAFSISSGKPVDAAASGDDEISGWRQMGEFAVRSGNATLLMEKAKSCFESGQSMLQAFSHHSFGSCSASKVASIGILHKRGNFYKRWQKRICLLHSDGLFFYFKRDPRLENGPTPPVGLIFLDYDSIIFDYPTETISGSGNTAPPVIGSFSFSLKCRHSCNLETGKYLTDRTFQFSGERLEEVMEWVQAIHSIIMNRKRTLFPPSEVVVKKVANEIDNNDNDDENESLNTYFKTMTISSSSSLKKNKRREIIAAQHDTDDEEDDDEESEDSSTNGDELVPDDERNAIAMRNSSSTASANLIVSKSLDIIADDLMKKAMSCNTRTSFSRASRSSFKILNNSTSSNNGLSTSVSNINNNNGPVRHYSESVGSVLDFHRRNTGNSSSENGGRQTPTSLYHLLLMDDAGGDEEDEDELGSNGGTAFLPEELENLPAMILSLSSLPFDLPETKEQKLNFLKQRLCFEETISKTLGNLLIELEGASVNSTYFLASIFENLINFLPVLSNFLNDFSAIGFFHNSVFSDVCRDQMLIFSDLGKDLTLLSLSLIQIMSLRSNSNNNQISNIATMPMISGMPELTEIMVETLQKGRYLQEQLKNFFDLLLPCIMTLDDLINRFDAKIVSTLIQSSPLLQDEQQQQKQPTETDFSRSSVPNSIVRGLSNNMAPFDRIMYQFAMDFTDLLECLLNASNHQSHFNPEDLESSSGPHYSKMLFEDQIISIPPVVLVKEAQSAIFTMVKEALEGFTLKVQCLLEGVKILLREYFNDEDDEEGGGGVNAKEELARILSLLEVCTGNFADWMEKTDFIVLSTKSSNNNAATKKFFSKRRESIASMASAFTYRTGSNEGGESSSNTIDDPTSASMILSSLNPDEYLEIVASAISLTLDIGSLLDSLKQVTNWTIKENGGGGRVEKRKRSCGGKNKRKQAILAHLMGNELLQNVQLARHYHSSSNSGSSNDFDEREKRESVASKCRFKEQSSSNYASLTNCATTATADSLQEINVTRAIGKSLIHHLQGIQENTLTELRKLLSLDDNNNNSNNNNYNGKAMSTLSWSDSVLEQMTNVLRACQLIDEESHSIDWQLVVVDEAEETANESAADQLESSFAGTRKNLLLAVSSLCLSLKTCIIQFINDRRDDLSSSSITVKKSKNSKGNSMSNSTSSNSNETELLIQRVEKETGQLREILECFVSQLSQLSLYQMKLLEAATSNQNNSSYTNERSSSMHMGEEESSHNNNNNNRMNSPWSSEDIQIVEKIILEERNASLKSGDLVLRGGDGSTGSSESLKAATLPALIERLTCEIPLDNSHQMINVLLLTYTNYSSAHELLSLLISRYQAVNSSLCLALQSSPHRLTLLYHKKKVIPVRLRVLNLLKLWFKQDFNLFFTNSSDDGGVLLIDRLLEFLGMARCDFKKAVEDFERIIDARKSHQNNSSNKNIDANNDQSSHNPPHQYYQGSSSYFMLEDPPSPILPKDERDWTNLMAISSIELARQWTLIDWSYFVAIKPEEFLQHSTSSSSSSSSSKSVKSGNILAMINYANRFVYWLASEIVQVGPPNTPKARGLLIKQLISVAERCRQLGNFNTLKSILAALDLSAIARLRKSWDTIPVRYRALHTRLRDLVSEARAYKRYRQALLEHLGGGDAGSVPCIPFLGVYLTNLVFIQVGNRTYISDGNESGEKKKLLLNFDKQCKIAKIIEEVVKFQRRTNYSSSSSSNTNTANTNTANANANASYQYQFQPIAQIQNIMWARSASNGSNGLFKLMDEEEIYKASLALEPRVSAIVPQQQVQSQQINASPPPV